MYTILSYNVISPSCVLQRKQQTVKEALGKYAVCFTMTKYLEILMRLGCIQNRHFKYTLNQQNLKSKVCGSP